MFFCLCVGVLVPQHFEVDGAGIVGDGSEINFAAAALDLGGENIAPDGDLAAVAQVIEAACLGRFEVFAVEQLDRLVRKGQALDCEVRRGLLGLKLDNGGLFLQILL